MQEITFKRVIQNTDLLNKLLEPIAENDRKGIKQQTEEIYASLLGNNSNGIIYGYIQSGKTLSMTSLIAKAREDEVFKLCIILTGTSIPTYRQNYKSIEKDIRAACNGERLFSFYPAEGESGITPSLQSYIQDDTNWDNISVFASKRMAVIVTLKENTWLKKLNAIIRKIGITYPVIIIDDEADQAGLDANASKPGKKPTPIHDQITELKRLLPGHRYLQYTATPQAPLLISHKNELAPEWARVLIPGENYTGLECFLPRMEIIEEPSWEKMPNSLKSAITEYLIRSIAAFNSSSLKFTSMLIHTANATIFHKKVTNQVRDYIEHLKGCANHNTLNDAIKSELKRWNVAEDLFIKELKCLSSSLKLQEVNTREGETPSVPFDKTYNIIVSGQAVARGFRVENLIITYLTRKTSKQADTHQQRARFLGYRKKYLQFCTVFLTEDSYVAYNEYMKHEKDLRATLQEFNGNLKDWSRTMLTVGEKRRPTRNAVLSDRLWNVHGWTYQKRINPENIDKNNATIEALLNKPYIVEQLKNPNEISRGKQHIAALKIKREDILELLDKWTYNSTEEKNSIPQIPQTSNKDFTVYCFGRKNKAWNTHKRGVDESYALKQLFEGRSEDSKRVSAREIFDQTNVTESLQLYYLKLELPNKQILGNAFLWTMHSDTKSTIQPSNIRNL